MDTARMREVLASARQEIAKVIIGQDQAIDMTLATILTGSHSLIEGVPGVAKTLLVRTLAKVLGCESQRIQFTPDLMPADITGTSVFNMKLNEFSLIKGPVFTTLLLGDEINRAPAKTQSALLQAMQERKVTIDRETYTLSPYFTVFATQNPIEYEGTYPLPEAQKDRFMFKIPMRCPEREGELLLATRTLGEDSPESILESGGVQSVVGMEELGALRHALRGIVVREEVIAYGVDLVRATRTNPRILVGAGPRATQNLLTAARALAARSDRDFVTPDDIKDVAEPVLAHRLILRPEFEIEGVTVEEVIQTILREVAVPR
ncbi:MAG: MoxR family ATPase [Lentisphaerae bacterium]|nr:MoxR family ATPase [Lentisphaerota bacterium]